jgi:diaminohydroxyphosphoribosylaminopyrimidine deaminase/5-amino-6-(5-phosphoribosylamino)uracil reductase
MARCLELARRAEGRTAPNPMVGCVIVDRRGRLVAEGFHRRIGAAHAEAEALAAAAKKRGMGARGATMYVNLEPCKHTRNRRTSPCAPRVLEAGIARLVVGMGDPLRSHSGGAAWLAKQGVAVTRGVLRAECADLNRGFVTWAKWRRPWFVLKAGVTLDGRVATRAGDSQWITGPAARKDAHRLRDRLDAVLVGVGTVLADDPRLTARVRGGRDPVRVVLDSRLRTPLEAKVLPANSWSKARVIVATTGAVAKARERRLAERGAEVWRLGDSGRVDVDALATALATEGVTTVLAEGGAAVHASLVDAGLADEVVLYVAPMVFGGRGRGAAPGWVAGEGVERIVDAARFRFAGEPRRVGDDLVLNARARRRR